MGLVILLDRYFWNLFFPSPISWTKELCVRAGSFLIGAAAFYFMRPGVVSLGEAAFRGMYVFLVVLLLEQSFNLVRSRGRWAKICLGGTLLLSFLLLIPLIAAIHPLHTVPKRTPAAFGLAFEDIRFETADGVQLAGWLISHRQARGNVIFCHGHGRNRGHVAGLLQTFHELHLNVLAFDFRGHGDSAGHTSTLGLREVDDLIAAEKYIGQRFPEQPVVLVGISLGAAVSLQALPSLPRVCGVWSEGAFARLSTVVAHQFSSLPRPFCLSLVSLYRCLGWLDCDLWAPSVNPIDRLNGLNVPIFFCHAQDDELVPFCEAQALHDSYTGPKCHWWVEGASHYNIRQRNHAEYLQRLRDFLEKCLSDGPTSTALR
jgi:pimeloyl-ACP methyl ester carboxylesterase